jgi:alpha-amylase/alpha-mannosidase (GH57 family)
LYKRGQIEITTSAFYHPILPLLYDTTVAKRANPSIKLPALFKHPEDAREQIKRGKRLFMRLFGRRPAGFWPPEGAVSEQIVKLLAEEGILWVASDEGVLKKTKEGASHYTPYKMRANGKDIFLLFRDRELSDLISFVYWSWDEKDAVDDFIQRLKKIEDKDAFLFLALDGENAWERYGENGAPFLNLLYKRLVAEGIQTTTVTDYLKERAKKVPYLLKLSPGSWINANFDVWIGKEEENLAWELLKRARETVGGSKEAMEYVYVAEGSDWFWWYGDEFPSFHSKEYDYLFRANLMKAYEVARIPCPKELEESLHRE